MESYAVESGISHGTLLIAVLGITAVILYAMLAGVLKMSLGMFAKESPSYFRCLAMVLLFTVINSIVYAGFRLTFGPQPWYIVACYQLMLQFVLIMVVARVNPFAAALTLLSYVLFGASGTALIALFIAFNFASVIHDLKKRTAWDKRAFQPALQSAPQQTTPQPAQLPVLLPSGVSSNPFAQ